MRMEMMGWIVILCLSQRHKSWIAGGIVTLGANSIAFHLQIPPMGVMAIRAAHPARIHLRLQKRAVNVDLVEDLPVGVIKTLSQQGETVMVVERGTCRGRG